MKKVRVIDLVGENAISMQSGSKFYAEIHDGMISGEKFQVDFDGVSTYASPFFNASVGLLLKDLTIEALQSQLTFINLSDIGRALLNHVIENALTFYKVGDTVSKGIDQSGSKGNHD